MRPTHERYALKARAPRTWRTHPDPFGGVWCEILHWLQKDPDSTAKDLLDRLIHHSLTVTAYVGCARYNAEFVSGEA